jgi:hypothetical protein
VQWVALTLWVIVTAIALPLSMGAVYGRASLGVQALAAVGGLGLTIAVCDGAPLSLAWWGVGCGAIGVLSVSVAAASLTAEREGAVPIRMEGAEEHAAGLAGLQLVMVVTTTMVTALVALDVGVAG